MKNMKLLSSALFLLSAILFSSCQSEVKKSQVCIGEPGTGVTGDKCHDLDDTKQASNPGPSSVASPSPTIHDVICFRKDINLAESGVRCRPEQIYKVPRGTKVTAFLKTVSSVQQGTQLQTYFKTDATTQESITVAEMESLSTQGAKIYAIDFTADPSNIVNKKHATQIYYFDQSSGGFQLRFEGALEVDGGETSKVDFTTGDSSQSIKASPSATIASASSSANTTAPDTLVQNYFASIKNGQYQKAWDMLPSDMQRNKSIHPNGYNSFTDWWKKTSVDVDAVKIVSQSDREAIVNADVRYKAQKGSPHPLHLRYFLKRNSSTDNWVITKIKS
jgi:hypothetical protein